MLLLRSGLRTLVVVIKRKTTICEVMELYLQERVFTRERLLVTRT